MKHLIRYLGIAILGMALAISAVAQTVTSTIVGRITDTNGAIVAGAEVAVTHIGTNQTRTVLTNESGEFRIPQLSPGTYTIRVSMANFKVTNSEEIDLLTDSTQRVNLTLEPGDINENVTVTAEAPVLNTETSEKAEVITQRQVEELPMNVRDFTELAKLVPGIYQRPTEDDQGQGVGSSGTRTDSTGFLLDGTSNRDDRNGSVGVNTSVDSIQEFKVSTSTYSAEFGRLAGAQISVISKSGTNRFSGSIFEFVRNDVFDAKNFFTAPDENKTLKRHQFGGSFGGPLPFFNFGEGGPIFHNGKDRTFFFVSYEQMREVRSQTARTVAPNAEWAIGDFRNVRGAGNDGIWGNADDTNRIMCLQISSNPLRPTKVECPTPNVIPLGADPSNPNLLYASPVSLAILDYLPRANDPNSLDGFNYSVISNILPRHLFSTKIDHKINDKNNLYVRYAIDNREAYQPQAGRFNYPGFLRDWDYKNTSIAFGDTHIFSPNVINDLRIGYSKMDRKTMNENNDQDYIALFGIPGLPNSSDPSLWGFPAIRIDGFPDTGDSANVPFNYVSKNFSVYDSLTWVFGDHNLKIGADLVKPNYEENDIRNVRGDFRFRGRFTNTSNSTSTGFRSFADFLYGIPDSTQRQLGAYPAELTAWQSAFYLQDNWRLNSWLTLNLGVRYDYTPFLYEKSDRISTFIPELGVTACAGGAFSDDEGNQICVDGASLGLGRALIKTDKNNFAPRVGFAVLPFGDNKTVVRGGAGIYYSTETINPARQMLANNYPYLNRQSYNRASTSDILQLTFTDPFPENRVNLQGVNTPQGIPLDAETPEVYHFNLTFERELTDDLGIEIGYVGSEGRKLGMRYNLNYQYPTGEIAGTGLPVVARAFPTYGDISYQIQGVNSSYHALQASIRRRSKNGLTLMASYTFGKAMDHNSNTNNSTTGSQRNPQDIHDFGRDWALADYHRTHQFSGTFNWVLPFGRGRAYFNGVRGAADALLSGWQLNGIVTMLSGRPFTPVFSTVDTAGGRPDLVGDPMADVPEGLYFNPAAFARPVATPEDPTLFGNAGRNIVIGPSYHNFDVSLFKNFRFREKMRLQLRWELFNVLNHPNFQVPQHLLGTSDTARIRSTANEGREMQFAARFTF